MQCVARVKFRKQTEQSQDGFLLLKGETKI